MRKVLLCALVLSVLFVWPGSSGAFAAEKKEWIKTDQLAKGIIVLDYEVKSGVKTKLLIVKGEGKYSYNLQSGVRNEAFPLQMGNGDYIVSLLEQVKGTTYRAIHKTVLTLNMPNPDQVYLNSVQNVKWSPSSLAVVQAKELIKDATTDEDKVQAIYEFVIDHIQYDNGLAFSASSEYLPQIDRTLTAKKDICYGYSALFAAMLRSVDIPAKLVMGTTDYVDTYHAWNEVLIGGKWVTIDTTVDAGWNGTTTSFQMLKEAAKYKTDRYY
ncbi:transglutaminase superfamily protein [Fontibacillus phaseoli]|uniref:Transglutaminase superfamily protein n=2 Tax=Fontibacillus phaseoli TaxID=1416533 RepID=A0A369BIJ8_9BACL|nr:transglutaminase superfamily protein [Fontibacillus phaseoli]